jgi:hypothetical protein
LYVLRTRNLRKPVYWFFRSQTQINQKWAKVLLSERLEDFFETPPGSPRRPSP